MYRAIGGVIFAIYLAMTFPQRYMAETADMDGGGVEEPVKVSKAQEARKKRKKRSRRAVGYRKRGHFSFNARLNGRNVKVLVDTGASSVAINRSTARRIGIRLKERDFRHRASTANGYTKFARAKIKEIRIDGILVRNVEAAVLNDSSLSGTLLGMSFLNKLKSFEIKRNKLVMMQ